MLTVLQAALQAEGLEARTTDSVDAALAALSSWTPDLVLLDVRMPGRLGFELQHWLQQQPQNARIPVVFLTQHDSVEDRAWGLANGAVDFISKSLLAPSSIHLLALRVRNLVMVQESQGLREALAAIVSANHQINNRLMVIMSAAELLKRRFGDGGADAEDLSLLDDLIDAADLIGAWLHRLAAADRWQFTSYLEGCEMLSEPAAGPDAS